MSTHHTGSRLPRKALIPSIILWVALHQLGLSFARCADFDIEVPTFGFKDSTGRDKFAQDLSKYFASVDAEIPNLTPREEDWLAKEKERLKELGESHSRESLQLSG